MKLKRIVCIVLASVIAVSCIGMSASAMGNDPQELGVLFVTATGKFNMDVPGNSLAKSSTTFPLEVGEVVSIRAVYSPASADVEIGLIAPDGLFYGLPAEKGVFDQSIEVNQIGHYRLAARNNSSDTISISGFVNY